MALRNKAHVSAKTGACWWIQIIKVANICRSDSRYCSKKHPAHSISRIYG